MCREEVCVEKKYVEQKYVESYVCVEGRHLRHLFIN